MSANAVLSINAKVGGLVQLDSLVNLLGKAKDKLVGFAKDAERLNQAMNRAAISVGDADSRTAGLIDTLALYTQTNKLSMAGLKLTEQQYGDLAVAAGKMAQATGQDMTEAFKRLTEQISKGSSRAVAEYGITIKSTGDRQKDAMAMVEALSERFHDQAVEAETLSEALFALENNVGTTVGVLLGGAGKGLGLVQALNKVNEALGKTNNFLASPASDAFFNTFWDQMTSLSVAADHFAISIEEAFNSLQNMIESGAFRAYSIFSGIDVETLRKVSGREEEQRSYAERVGMRSQAFRAAAVQGSVASAKGDYESMLKDFGLVGGGQFGIEGAGGGRRGGGGKKKAKTAEQIQKERIAADDDLLSGAGSFDSARADEAGFFADFGGAQESDVERQQRILDIESQRLAVRASLATTDDEMLRIENERIALIQRKIDLQLEHIEESGYDQESPEYQEQMMEVERLRAEQTLAMRAQEIEQIDEWRLAWERALTTVDEKMRITTSVTGLFEDATRTALQTIIQGSDSVIHQVAKMVKGYALNVGIEMTIDGLKNTAKAIAEAVSSWGTSPRIEGFAAAAAASYAAAAVAFGVSGGAGLVAKKTMPRGGGSAAAGNVGGQYEQRAQQIGTAPQRVDVHVAVDDDGNLFSYVAGEQDRRARTGRAA